MQPRASRRGRAPRAVRLNRLLGCLMHCKFAALSQTLSVRTVFSAEAAMKWSV